MNRKTAVFAILSIGIIVIAIGAFMAFGGSVNGSNNALGVGLIGIAICWFSRWVAEL